jgi:hypothetical protein
VVDVLVAGLLNYTPLLARAHAGHTAKEDDCKKMPSKKIRRRRFHLVIKKPATKACTTEKKGHQGMTTLMKPQQESERLRTGCCTYRPQVNRGRSKDHHRKMKMMKAKVRRRRFFTMIKLTM